MQDKQGEKKALWVLPLSLVVAAGVAVRFIGLGRQSYWTDEIAAILVSGRSFMEVLLTIAVQDVNPPLYYLILHFWLAGGTQEGYVRLLSVIFSGLALGVVFFLARRFFDTLTAVFATLLMAFFPLSVYLAQEVRYYSLLELETALAFWGYLKVREKKSALWLFVPVVLGLYTHYYFLFVFLVLIGWFGFDFIREKIKDASFARPMLLALLAWTPWVGAIYVQAGRGSFAFRPPIGLGEMLVDLATFLTLGHADGLQPWKPIPLAASFLWAALPFALMLGIFVIAGRNRSAVIKLVLWIFLPLVLVAIASRFINIYGHRYFVIAIPAVCLAVAGALGRLSRIHIGLGVAAALALFSLQAISLHAYFTDGRYWREDWRGLATYIESEEREHDALLVYNASQSGPLNFYYTGNLPQIPVLTGDMLTFHQEDKKPIEKRLETYFQKYRRVFFLTHFSHMYEPAGYATNYVDENGIEDIHPDFFKDYKIPLHVCFTSRKNAFRAMWKTYDSYIDFSKGNFHPSQIDGQLSHLKDPWVWMGKWARFYLRFSEKETIVRIKVMVDLTYHKDQSVPFFLLADGKPIQSFLISKSGMHEFRADLPPIQGELIEIGFYTTRVFNPQEFFGGEDQSPKSFLVGYVGVE